jgi:hypothetical protein
MSLDKKAILKEIEVLIRSIKVHYDNIENEYRIPTIELELITSKIRKLHEKSIIYNHLHYLEEEQLQSARRIKIDQLIFKHTDEEQKPDDLNLEVKPNEFYNTQVRFDKKIAEIEKATSPEAGLNEALEIAPSLSSTIAEEPKEQQIVEKAVEPFIESKIDTSFKQIKLQSKIGINDRFRFIKNLFGGNGVAMEEAIKEIEECTSAQALAASLDKLKNNNQWNEEDENVIDFMGLVK